MIEFCPHEGPEIQEMLKDIVRRHPETKISKGKCALCTPDIQCSACGEKGHVYCHELCEE